jgi:hypothetical protein
MEVEHYLHELKISSARYEVMRQKTQQEQKSTMLWRNTILHHLKTIILMVILGLIQPQVSLIQELID